MILTGRFGISGDLRDRRAGKDERGAGAMRAGNHVCESHGFPLGFK